MEFYYNFANISCIVSSCGTYKIVHSSASFPFFFKQLQTDTKSMGWGESHISIKNFIQITHIAIARHRLYRLFNY